MDFFDDVWDRGIGIFDRFIDFEIGKTELELANDVAQFQAEQALADANRQRELQSFTDGDFIGGFSMRDLLIIGGLGLGAILLLR